MHDAEKVSDNGSSMPSPGTSDLPSLPSGTSDQHRVAKTAPPPENLAINQELRTPLPDPKPTYVEKQRPAPLIRKPGDNFYTDNPNYDRKNSHAKRQQKALDTLKQAIDQAMEDFTVKFGAIGYTFIIGEPKVISRSTDFAQIAISLPISYMGREVHRFRLNAALKINGTRATPIQLKEAVHRETFHNLVEAMNKVKALANLERQSHEHGG